MKRRTRCALLMVALHIAMTDRSLATESQGIPPGPSWIIYTQWSKPTVRSTPFMSSNGCRKTVSHLRGKTGGQGTGSSRCRPNFSWNPEIWLRRPAPTCDTASSASGPSIPSMGRTTRPSETDWNESSSVLSSPPPQRFGRAPRRLPSHLCGSCNQPGLCGLSQQPSPQLETTLRDAGRDGRTRDRNPFVQVKWIWSVPSGGAETFPWPCRHTKTDAVSLSQPR